MDLVAYSLLLNCWNLVLTHNTAPGLTREHSPDGATSAHLMKLLTTQFIDHERMKGWVGLVGWPAADGLPTQMVSLQLQVECRTVKALRPRTNCATHPYLTALSQKYLKLTYIDIMFYIKRTLKGISLYSSRNILSWLIQMRRSPSVNSYGMLNPSAPYLRLSSITPWKRHSDYNNQSIDRSIDRSKQTDRRPITTTTERLNEWKKIYIARLKAYKCMLNLPRLAEN